MAGKREGTSFSSLTLTPPEAKAEPDSDDHIIPFTAVCLPARAWAGAGAWLGEGERQGKMAQPREEGRGSLLLDFLVHGYENGEKLHKAWVGDTLRHAYFS